MRRLGVSTCILAICALAAPGASAGPILWEGAFNQDGAVHSPGTAPTNWNLAAFDTGTGLGTITTEVTGAGLHNLLVFLDIEIDEEVNGFYNEYGDALGAPLAGLMWEIDEPGYDFGDIYGNFLAGALDGTNAVPAALPDDVSFALGWSFALAGGEVATLRFSTSTTLPPGGFYLRQTDPDSDSSVYFSSGMNITGGEQEVPEPATLWLLGAGLAFGARRFVRRG